MIFTRPRIALIAIGLFLFYWVPAFYSPETVKASVNAVYFLLAMMTTFMLIPDVWDIIKTHGHGISWQAAMAKIGLFILFAAFTCARLWGFIVGVQDFPRSLLESPVGGFFTFLQGIGLLLVFYGFNSAGELRPKVTVRGTALFVFTIGLVVGLVIGQIGI
jgi:hypothetical protein